MSLNIYEFNDIEGINYELMDKCFEKEPDKFKLVLLIIEHTRNLAGGVYSTLMNDQTYSNKIITAIKDMAHPDFSFNDLRDAINKKNSLSRHNEKIIDEEFIDSETKDTEDSIDLNLDLSEEKLEETKEFEDSTDDFEIEIDETEIEQIEDEEDE